MKEVIPYGHMVQEYYVGKLREFSEKRNKERAKIKTKAQAEKFVASVRQKLLSSFGPMPKRTALKPQITGKIIKDDVVIEKLIFESRPGFPVTANLYRPKEIKGKCPGVIGTCGHASEGKAAGPYHSFSLNLAKNGFVVLIYDPISQGERKQYLKEKHPLVPPGLCAEHNMLGNNMYLNGEFFGMWRAWDGIRALDYLLTRPEVDPNRMGVTGNSGGGTLSSYLNALDGRFTMAAPSCFVTTYVHNIENELPQDSEQIPPNFLKFGLDMADFFIARAPRPAIILGQRDDFFDARGVVETYEEVKRIYKLLGKEKNVECFVGPDNHGYHLANREAMYKFFNKHAGIKAKSKEPELKVSEEKELFCTKKGQVLDSLKGCKKVFEFTAEKGAALKSKRKKKTKAELDKALLSALAIKLPKKAPYYRKLRAGALPENNMCFSRFAIETEPGIQGILFGLKQSAPRNYIDAGKSATLYIPHLSSREDISNKEFELLEKDRDVYAFDARGVGESLPITCNMQGFFNAYDSDYLYACLGSMLGEPFLGRKVLDVLSAISLLKDEGYKNIRLIGRGMGALTAAFAGALSKDVKEVFLKNALLSYHELTQIPAYKWPFSHMLKGALKQFDLPDVYSALESKKLILLNPWDEKMEEWDKAKCLKHAKESGINPKLIKFS